MKTMPVLILLLLLAGSSAWAGPPEFELTYEDCAPGGVVFYTGGQYVTGSAEPLRELRGVPKIDSSRTWYFQAQLGDEGAGRVDLVLILPVSERVAYLSVDTDRDGDLRDELFHEHDIGRQNVRLPALDVTRVVGGRELPHRVRLEANLRGRKPRITLRTAGCYRGRVVLDGSEYDTVLFDATGNGLYDDTKYSGDSLYLSPNLDRGPGDRAPSVRCVILDDVWHYLEPAADGASIRVAGSSDELAELTTNFDVFNLELRSPRIGRARLHATNGAIRLPPGDYEWTDYFATCKEPSGKIWNLMCGTVLRVPFRVAPGENRLDLCFPFRQRLTAVTKGDEVTFDQQILCRAGGSVYVTPAAGGAPLKPSFVVESLDGKEILDAAFESG